MLMLNKITSLIDMHAMCATVTCKSGKKERKNETNKNLQKPTSSVVYTMTTMLHVVMVYDSVT